MFFIEQSGTSQFQYLAESIRIVPDDKNFDWIACLMANSGDRDKCLGGATGFGLREIRVEATLIIASVCLSCFLFFRCEALLTRSGIVDWIYCLSAHGPELDVCRMVAIAP